MEIKQPCSPFEKVTELEWYLSIKEMEANKQDFPISAPNSTTPEEIVTLQKFNQFWKEMWLPAYNQPQKEYALYSPLDLKLCLPPGGNFEIPLGFGLNRTGFSLFHNNAMQNITFSLQKSIGPSMPRGYNLSICNITKAPAIIHLEKDAEIARGTFAYASPVGEDLRRLYLVEESTKTKLPTFVIITPNLFHAKTLPEKVKEALYLTIEDTGTEHVFHVQYQSADTPNPLTDGVIDTIHYEDIHRKFKLVNIKDGRHTVATMFYEAYVRALKGDAPIPRKKYIVPLEGKEWVSYLAY